MNIVQKRANGNYFLRIRLSQKTCKKQGVRMKEISQLFHLQYCLILSMKCQHEQDLYTPLIFREEFKKWLQSTVYCTTNMGEVSRSRRSGVGSARLRSDFAQQYPGPLPARLSNLPQGSLSYLLWSSILLSFRALNQLRLSTPSDDDPHPLPGMDHGGLRY